jgi:hypothetical protein
VPEFSGKKILQEVEILNREWLIKPKLGYQQFRILRRHVRIHHSGNRITGGEAKKQKKYG